MMLMSTNQQSSTRESNPASHDNIESSSIQEEQQQQLHHHQPQPLQQQFACLYTKQKTQKRKVWNDGRLVPRSGGSWVLYDANPPLGSTDAPLDQCEVVTNTTPFIPGTLLEMEKHLVTVEGPWMKTTRPYLLTTTNATAITAPAPSHSQAMRKIMQRKFQRPPRHIPPPPCSANPNQLQPPYKRLRRPLQPGELQQQYYGGPVHSDAAVASFSASHENKWSSGMLSGPSFGANDRPSSHDNAYRSPHHCVVATTTTALPESSNVRFHSLDSASSRGVSPGVAEPQRPPLPPPPPVEEGTEPPRISVPPVIVPPLSLYGSRPLCSHREATMTERANGSNLNQPTVKRDTNSLFAQNEFDPASFYGEDEEEEEEEEDGGVEHTSGRQCLDGKRACGDSWQDNPFAAAVGPTGRSPPPRPIQTDASTNGPAQRPSNHYTSLSSSLDTTVAPSYSTAVTDRSVHQPLSQSNNNNTSEVPHNPATRQHQTGQGSTRSTSELLDLFGMAGTDDTVGAATTAMPPSDGIAMECSEGKEINHCKRKSQTEAMAGEGDFVLPSQDSSSSDDDADSQSI